jgi:hypothetical protein
MKKIDVRNYFVSVTIDDGTTVEVPYNVKESLVSCIFHPELKLGGRDIIERDVIAKKIESAEDYVLLEDAEYQKLLNAFETVHGFGKAEVELVRRVFEAEDVEVVEK